MSKTCFLYKFLLIIVFIVINLCISPAQGEYIISFYAKSQVASGSISCSNYNNFTYGLLLEDEYSKEYPLGTDGRLNTTSYTSKCSVSNKFKTLKIKYLDTNISLCSYSISNNTQNNYKTLTLYPGKQDIGKKYVSVYDYNNSFNGSINITYHIEIIPDKINCQTSDERKLLYEDTICIRATKGFSKEVYKWRYSYNNDQGILIEGSFTPFKTEDNGATIYVKGSDFLSETAFNKLVETQNGITIIPDGADRYYKPLSVEGVNLTAKPTCPFIIKPIKVIQPKCYGYYAEQVKLKLNRGLLNYESIKVLLTHENGNPQKDTIISQIKNNEILFDYNDTIISGNWIVEISGTYLDKDKEIRDSYSKTPNHQGEFTITAPDPLSLKIRDSLKTKCSGESNGGILYHIVGGTGSKTYTLFSNNTQIESITQDSSEVCTFKDLKAGTYYISTTDANGCKYEKDETITIGEPTPVTLSASTISNPKCQGSYDGVIKYNTSGGTGNIKCYLQNLLHEVKDSTYSNSFSGLSAGTYFLCAKDTNNCVSNTIETRLKAPDALNLSLETKNVTINGTNNGRLSATFSGGTGTYTLYYLNKREDYSFPIENLLLGNNLFAGEGSVTLYDSNGCSTSKNYNITEPDTISAIVKQIDFIKCFGDNTASLKIDSIAGGMGGYSVEWNGTDDFTSKETYLGNLSAGYYLVTLKDSVGAKTIYEITIDEPNKISLLSSVTNTACVGEASGSILLNANGGTAPYKFSLNEQYSTNGEYNQLGIGSYNVSVEDENGCTTDSIVEVKTLSDINLNVTSSSPSCYNINNGTISISIDNGVRPYYVRCTDDNFLQVENNLELTNLEAGNYNIEVKDALGCIKTAETILIKPKEFNIELPEKIYLCNEQSKDINIESERVTNVDWYLNNDLIHTGLNNKLTQEGVYRLDFLYDEQCHSFKEISVDTINKKVDANFLVAAEVPINDDAHLINITPKENYEYVEWIYPTNDAWVYGEDEHSFQLVFLNEGIYQVGMIAHNDKCTASLFKTIKTFTPSSNNASEDNTYHITDLSIDKSPNNGKFISYVSLSAKTDVKLYLYNSSTGHIIATKEVSGEKSYEIPFSVNATAGEYILLAVAPQWQKSKWIKMIIK